MQLSDYVNIDVLGGRWRCSDTGTGPAVVLLHGFPDTPQSWTEIGSELAGSGFRVIVPYLPGYHPDALLEGPPRSTTAIGQLLIELLVALDVDRAVLVGHDWGADIAYRAFAAEPERVRGLVPIAIPHPGSVSPSPALLWRARHFINLRIPPTAARVRRNDFRYLEVLVERWAPHWFGLDREGVLARAKAAFADPAVLEAAIGYYRTVSFIRGGDVNRLVLTGPGLIVAGENDMVPLSAFHRTVAKWDGDVTLDVVPGAGHWPHREYQDRFLDSLHTFLARVPA